MKILPTRGNEPQLEIAFRMMALYPDDEECVRQIAEQHNLQTNAKVLEGFRRYYPERVQEAREDIAQLRERETIADLSDNIVAANRAVALALKKTYQRLEENKIAEPSKAGRDAADIMSKSVDKSRLLQDKPTTIVVKKTAEEDIKTLVRLGVLEVPDAEVVEDES